VLRGNLTDRIADTTNELNNTIFSGGFGKVTDIEMVVTAFSTYSQVKNKQPAFTG
jgi:hypothetical protein